MSSCRKQVHEEVMALIEDKKLNNDMVKYFVRQLIGETVYNNSKVKIKNVFDNNIIYLDEHDVDWRDPMFDKDVFNTENVFNLSCLCRVNRHVIGYKIFITFKTTVGGRKVRFVTNEDDWLGTDVAKQVKYSNVVKLNGLFLIHMGWDKYTMVPLTLGVYK